MSRINVENIRHPDAASDSLQLSDTGNITAPGNLSVTGTSTLTDDLNVDSGTLFVDASTNRVGVGLTSPESPLHVESSSETIVTIEGNNTAAGAGGVLVLKNNDTSANNLNQIQGADAGGQTCSAISFVNVDQANNEGELRFLTRPSSGSPTEVLRLTSNGTLQLRNSPGIDFSQIQTNAAGMTSELLDSYEEGTWTPVVKIGGTTIDSSGYSLSGANYVKIGSMVYVALTITSIEKGANTGTVTFEGIPFSISSGSTRADYSGVMRWQGIGTSSGTIVPYFVAGTTRLELQKYNSSTGYYGNVSDADLDTSFSAYFIGGWYTAA
jgi:hypothetical protein